MKYKAYPEYKDSGVDWLEKLPAHWEISKLRYMFTFSKGLTITKENLTDEGVPCVNYGEVHSKYGFEVDPAIHSLKCVSESYLKSSPSALLSRGDLVFADTSEDIEGSGNFTQLTSEQPIFAGYHTIIARPFNRESSRFYAYLLDSLELRTQVRHAVKGVKVFSITQAILRGINVWLPTTEEQKQIANFLDHETAKIDTLIEKQQQLIKLLKEKRQAVISHAVTKGLNPNAPMKDSGIEWLGEVPAHWEVWKLNHFAPIITCGVAATPSYVDEGVAFLSAQNVKNRKVDLSKGYKCITSSNHEELTKNRIPINGDILLSRVGTVGEVCVIDVSFEFSIFVSLTHLRLNQMTCLNDFFVNLCESKYVKSLHGAVTLVGGGVGNLNVNDLRVYKLPIPPLKEQRAIVQWLDIELGKIDKLISKAEQAIKLIKERRTALISAAVTGKIDVRSWGL